jgi:hypothetical protein
MVGVAGVTAMETSVAAVTVSVVAPLTPPEAAVIADVPAVFVVARPPLEMVATPAVPEVQVAVVVRSLVELSLYVPIAVNCLVRPAATEGLVGETVINVNVGVLGVLLEELHETSTLNIASAMRRGRAFTMASLPATNWGWRTAGKRVGECTEESVP